LLNNPLNDEGNKGRQGKQLMLKDTKE